MKALLLSNKNETPKLYKENRDNKYLAKFYVLIMTLISFVFN